ncbi:MAG: YraN family protein [Patescibacteria group bacterium]
MGHKKARIGFFGETVACMHIKRLGFSVVQRNWRCAGGEIDIIGKKGGLIVFFEVKTLDKHVYQNTGLVPEDNFTPAKLSRFIMACNVFIAKNQDLVSDDLGWRLDLVSVVLPEFLEERNIERCIDFCEIKHFENVVSWGV